VPIYRVTYTQNTTYEAIVHAETRGDARRIVKAGDVDPDDETVIHDWTPKVVTVEEEIR
jgi:hypothetical protein